MNLVERQSTISNLRNTCSKLEGEKGILEKMLKLKQIETEHFKKQIVINNDASQFLQKLADLRHSKIKQRIERSVSIGLATIFENDDIGFKINTEKKRNAISSSFKISKEEFGIELDPRYAFGGSLLDAISVILRILFNELNMPKTEGPIILDEVGKFIDSEYQKNFIIFLRKVSNEISRQIILVTHFQSYMKNANKLIRVVQDKGKSKVIYERTEER